MIAPTMAVLVEYPHVTERSNKDGTKRYYFRRRGQPLAKLSGEPGSKEFAEEYERQLYRVPIGQKCKHGTFGWLCDQYLDSSDFRQKADATKIARRRIILAMQRERIDSDLPQIFAQVKVKDFKRTHAAVLRDRKAENPHAANERLKILSVIFSLAVEDELIEHNPIDSVKRMTVSSDGHRTATEADLEAYEAFHTKGPAKRAMVLLRAFGMRVSDLRIIGPQHVRNGYLTFETVKTGVLCELEMTDEVRSEVSGCREMIFLQNENGAAFKSDKVLSQRISKWFKQAGVQGITAHSVRKWLATKMANEGAGEYELMSYFGWRDPKEARPYIKQANRKRLASQASARIRSISRVTQEK